MLRVAICDGDRTCRRQLREEVRTYALRRKRDLEVWEFGSGEELLSVNPHVFQIILLEISLSGRNGLDVAKALRECGCRSAIAFVTAVADYVFQGYECCVTGYMIKPADREELWQFLDRAVRAAQSQRDVKRIRIKNRSSFYCLALSAIRYIETSDRKTLLHLEEHLVQSSLKMYEYESLLWDDFFMRCHASYLVNLDYVYRISRQEIELITGEIIPISRQRRRKIIERMEDFLAHERRERGQPRL